MSGAARAGLAGAGLVAGLLGVALVTAPPAPRTLTPTAAPPVRGAYHVHTDRSDGSGKLDAVAAAAAAAGLDFVVVTDHGDGTRAPEPAAYRAGVLLIDAVEVSAAGGHVVALGLAAAPYPLAGEARAVVEDVQRLGGLALAAHPDSPRDALAWHAGDLPIDGVEWLNADSAWRDEGWPTLAAALLRYPAGPAAALGALFDRPVEALAWWDALAGRQHVTGVAAIDAHARLGPGDDDGRVGAGLPLPSYEATFRLASVALDGVTLTGEPAADATAVLDAIGGGRVYSVVDGLASPGVLRLAATRGEDVSGPGDTITPGQPFDLMAGIDGPDDARLDLLRDGAVVATSAAPELRYQADGTPGVYRVEVHLPGAPGTPPVPWMVSNPIYVRAVGSATPGGDAGALANARPAPPLEAWRIEASPVSEGAIDADRGPDGEPVTLLRYAVSGRASESPYVAFVVPVDGLFETRDRIVFTVRTDRPMRLDVQLRTPTPLPGAGTVTLGERWHRSVWADTTAREVVVALDELLPRGPTREPSPEAALVDSLLFVVDTVNTPAGTGGRIWISDLRVGRVP